MSGGLTKSIISLGAYGCFGGANAQRNKGGSRAAPNIGCRSARRADLPDHTCTWDLDQRTVGGSHKMRVGAPVSHRAVIHHIGASVGAKPDIGWAVEPVDVAHERLVA